MTKPMGIGLQKQVVELVLADGVKNKLAAEVRPDGQLFDIQNAELQYVGKMTRRKGFNVVDSHTIGPEVQTILDGTYQRLFQRDGELCCISDLSVSVGSGVGSRDTGDTIFSFSSVENGWKPHGKVPRSTLSAYKNFAVGEANTVSDCAVTATGACIIAWYGKTTNGIAGTFIRIIDLNTNATLLDTTLVGGIYVGGIGEPPKVQCAAIGSRLYVFYMETTAVVFGRYYDSSNRTGAITPTLAGAGTVMLTFTPTDWSVHTDGASIFIVGGRSAAPSIMSKWDAGLTVRADTNLSTIAAPGPFNVHIDCRFGLVSIAYLLNTGAVQFEQFSNLGVRTGSLTGLTFPGNSSKCAVLTLSASRVGVFANSVGVAWAPVVITAGTSLQSSAAASVQQVEMGGAPFLVGGHVCLPFYGIDAATGDSGYGYVVAEIDMSDSSSFSREVPLPVAAFGQDFANPRFSNDSGTVYGLQPLARGIVVGNVWYYLARFLVEAIFAPTFPEFLAAPAQLQMMKLDFNDGKRWLEAPLKQSTVLGSSLPSCYDGRVSHECGFLFRPRTYTLSAIAGGGLAVGKTYFFRLVYVWTDAFGDRWFSQPSYASRFGDTVSFTADVTNKSFSISVRPLVLSGKAANSNYEQQDIQIWLFMTRVDEPNDYFLHQKVHQSPWISTAITMTVTQESPAGAEEIYTGGGELENYAPPPAVSICAHRDRLLAINDLTQSLWYTKPAAAGRGVEWSLEQQVPIPETGMAVVSNEAAAVIFTKESVYSLEGYGPSPTGQPPDAFGRLIEISGQGLVEKNAAINTPVGVVFRSSQGWYVVRNTMAVEYIGADVEGRMQPLDTVSSMVVDQARGVLRIAVTGAGGNGYILNYWYDTNRWSRDIIATGGFIQDTLIIGAEYYMIQRGSVLKYDVTGAQRVDGVDPGDGSGNYVLRVDTGWFTFGNLENTKRIWRAYATVKSNDASATTNLDMLIYGDWDDVTPIASRVFSSITPGAVSTLRTHLPKQKLKAVKVVIREEAVDPGGANVPGLDFISLGFELGLKRGGPKVPLVQTA